MKCPKCGTENGDRTICTKCGLFMYKPMGQNMKKMTQAERSKEDAKIMWKNTKKVLKVIWMIIVIIAMSFVLLAALMSLFNMI